jgi:hypothetical protein
MSPYPPPIEQRVILPVWDRPASIDQVSQGPAFTKPDHNRTRLLPIF